MAMTIACLGWGSLIWNPGNLPIISAWAIDGPPLPIEFARESSRNLITLVLTQSHHRVTSLWSLMASDDLAQAKAALAHREDVSERFIDTSIGFWERKSDNSHGLGSEIIKNWAWSRDLDAVIWTNLKFGFAQSRDVMPSVDEVIKYLQSLPPENSKESLDYIKNAPEQIDTPYRRLINDRFKL